MGPLPVAPTVLLRVKEDPVREIPADPLVLKAPKLEVTTPVAADWVIDAAVIAAVVTAPALVIVKAFSDVAPIAPDNVIDPEPLFKVKFWVAAAVPVIVLAKEMGPLPALVLIVDPEPVNVIALLGNETPPAP